MLLLPLFLAMDHRFSSPEERDCNGNICASVKNLPLHIVVRSSPMNFGGGIHMTVGCFVFVNTFCATSENCQLIFFKLMLNACSSRTEVSWAG